MITLSQPLTIEDWLGNVYLLKPINARNKLPNIKNKSSVLFHKPDVKERKSKMIKKVMVAATVDKQSISSLLRSLKQQLKVDLNLDNIKVFKLCSKFPQDRSDKNVIVNNNLKDIVDDKNLNTNSQLSSTIENSNAESDELSSFDKDIDEEISKFQSNKSSPKSELEESVIDKIFNVTNNDIGNENDNEKENCMPNTNKMKFTFFICWFATKNTKKNYFHLPSDKSTDQQNRLISNIITSSRKCLLTSYLKMIEKIAGSQVKYKSIIQSQQADQLYYRKIIIYATNRDGIWLTLQLFKEHLPDMIRNAVFYQPSLQSNMIASPKLSSLMKSQFNLKNGNRKLNYASEKYLKSSLACCKQAKKVSKIPVLLTQKYRINYKKIKCSTPFGILGDFDDYVVSQIY